MNYPNLVIRGIRVTFARLGFIHLKGGDEKQKQAAFRYLRAEGFIGQNEVRPLKFLK